jgi:hypothetical protein
MVNILSLFFAEKHLKNACEFESSYFLESSATLPKVEGSVVDIFDGEQPEHLEVQLGNLRCINCVIIGIVFIDFEEDRDYFEKGVAALVRVNQADRVQKFPNHRFYVSVAIFNYL